MVDIVDVKWSRLFNEQGTKKGTDKKRKQVNDDY